MRERLDCAVLLTTCSEQRIRPEAFTQAKGRLHLQALCKSVDVSVPGSASVLAAHAMQLCRFDVCLLVVSESNLAWTRTMLSSCRGVLKTPVMALACELKACALNDLCTLGVADFLRYPLCQEELRVRIERLLDRQRRRTPTALPASTEIREGNARHYGLGRTVTSPNTQQICDTILERSGAELEAFAVASASRYASTSEPFRRAKGQVIERFERAYITAALSRHSGNIAMAARSAQKHRRAFWALMRKHSIDAAPFRSPHNTNTLPDG